jgi:hypothetical protein
MVRLGLATLRPDRSTGLETSAGCRARDCYSLASTFFSPYRPSASSLEIECALQGMPGIFRGAALLLFDDAVGCASVGAEPHFPHKDRSAAFLPACISGTNNRPILVCADWHIVWVVYYIRMAHMYVRVSVIKYVLRLRHLTLRVCVCVCTSSLSMAHTHTRKAQAHSKCIRKARITQYDLVHRDGVTGKPCAAVLAGAWHSRRALALPVALPLAVCQWWPSSWRRPRQAAAALAASSRTRRSARNNRRTSVCVRACASSSDLDPNGSPSLTRTRRR